MRARQRLPSRVLAACIAASLGTALGPAQAYASAAVGPEPSPEVQDLNARAVEKFKNKEYEEAIDLFKQAYDLSPEPNYLFNIGRVYEQKGDFKNAVEFYGRFLREPEVDLKSREIALERRRVLTGVLDETEPGWNGQPAAEQPELQPEAEPKPEPEPEPAPEPETKKPSKLRLTGYILLGVGGAALVTGAAFAGIAKGNENDLADLGTLEERDEVRDKGRRNAIIADSMLIAGGAIAATGLVLVLVSLKKKPSATARARVVPAFGPRGGGITAVLRF